MSPSHADVVVVGGGHNGLTAAAYLAQAGLSVAVLERLDEWGGAAVSHQAFPGVDARLSRYSYLVSLLPQKIIDDLSLPISLAKRRYSSYTPVPGDHVGLLIDNEDADLTQESFARLRAANDFPAWNSFYSQTGALARALFPGVTDPLITRSEAKEHVARLTGEPELFDRFIETPIGDVIENTFSHDVVRGVVLTDGLIGTFAPNHDPNLDANKCFLYHVMGGGTGDWDVPVGGMGAVTEISDDNVVAYTHEGSGHTVSARYVLVNASPRELDALRDRASEEPGPEGAQVKVNMVLKRLPHLKDSSLTPEAAFGGTFHINETWSQLQTGFEAAESGAIPDPLPCEIYCHSLSDPSILSPELHESGAHTLTVFGLHVPHRLTQTMDNDSLRTALQEAVVASLNSVLAEPLEDVILQDAEGNLCVETKTTRDLEDALGLPGGNIFHGPLEWPFVEDDEDLSTPERRWGVATSDEGVFLCGSGARRGGAVSGIAGHNAAMAVLERESL